MTQGHKKSYLYCSFMFFAIYIITKSRVLGKYTKTANYYSNPGLSTCLNHFYFAGNSNEAQEWP